MPLYEYQCEACGHRFEKIQKFSDPPIEVCPQCGGTVHKLIASPAFQFKGSGWYITDYAKKDSGTKDKESKDGKDSKEKESSSPAKEGAAAKSESSSGSSDSSSGSSSSSSSSSSSASKPAAKE